MCLPILSVRAAILKLRCCRLGAVTASESFGHPSPRLRSSAMALRGNSRRHADSHLQPHGVDASLTTAGGMSLVIYVSLKAHSLDLQVRMSSFTEYTSNLPLRKSQFVVNNLPHLATANYTTSTSKDFSPEEALHECC